MKRIITLSIAALLSGAILAQNTKQSDKKQKENKEWKHKGKHGKHGKERGEFVKDLDLTDAQKEQLKSIKQEQKAKQKALKDERKQKVDRILTAEQKQKIAAKKDQRKAEAKAKGEKRFEKMQQELNLSNEQGQKLKAMNEEFRNKRKAIHDNTSLSQEQKKEQMRSLAEQHRSSIKNILTAEQMEKMKTQRGKKRAGRNAK